MSTLIQALQMVHSLSESDKAVVKRSLAAPPGTKAADRTARLAAYKEHTGHDLIVGTTVVEIDTKNESAQFRTIKPRHGRPIEPGTLTLISDKHVNWQSGDQPGEENLVVAKLNSAVKVVQLAADGKLQS